MMIFRLTIFALPLLLRAVLSPPPAPLLLADVAQQVGVLLLGRRGRRAAVVDLVRLGLEEAEALVQLKQKENFIGT